MTNTLALVLLLIVSFKPKALGFTTDGECQSIEIRTREHLAQLRNCVVIIGSVSIINLHVPEEHLIEDSKVEEITGYLLVYRSQGIRSLEKIFPRLVLIRGNDLLFEKYSFAVFENEDLENLGLKSLLRIENGDIRIEKNPSLCFVHTINWVYLFGNHSHHQLYLKTKPLKECPVCKEPQSNDINFNKENREVVVNCWNLNWYQKRINAVSNCPSTCGAIGCTATKKCCNKNCLNGCFDVNCSRCANLQHGSRCVDVCPIPYLVLNNRQCITEAECSSRNWIIFGRSCIENCPAHYRLITRSGKNVCMIQCKGDYIINVRKDLINLKDCNLIEGSLTIELKNIKDNLLDELRDSLKNIKEITEYLKIQRSSQLLSLDFLSSLHTIRGEKLIDGRYAFYLVDNHHLENIWQKNQNVAILKGKIFFHLNPRLCYEKIIATVASSVKSGEKITIQDVSKNSNGERAICGKDTERLLNATVEAINSTAVRIKVNPLPAEEKNVLIGYLHYYKEAPTKNVSVYDARHGCGHDNWLMDMSLTQNVRHVITNLKKNTQYAYFLKTITVTSSHIQIDAYSEIDYFRTLPGQPSRIADVYFFSPSSTEIVIHWWPPRIPNGKIGKYIVEYKHYEDNSTINVKTLGEVSGDSVRGECECTFKNPFFSGPIPEHENYYNREQITFDNALQNFIYVPRKMPVRKAKSDESDATIKGNKTNDNNVNKKESEEEAKLLEERLLKYHQEVEKQSLNQQDTGIKDFYISPPIICSKNGNNQQFLIETSCSASENINGTLVSGELHTYRMQSLSPDTKYSISIRACTVFSPTQYNCGKEMNFVAKTISKRLDSLFQNLGIFDKV